ncbi:MAG: universal stress protein [Chitinophagales bacterium]|nr:universal stress protein [Chitinophagales bacterium]
MNNQSISQISVNKILVPIDFSEISIKALEYAAVIARQANAEILLLHVYESYSQNTNLDMVVDFPEIIEKGIQNKMSEIKEKNQYLKDITINSKVAVGKIHAQIECMARNENVKLIVMATHGVSGITNIDKYIIGSNAYRTIQSAPSPIITMREEPWKKSFKDILLPLDSTDESTEKLDIAIGWAKFFGSTIHLLAITAFFEDMLGSAKDVELKVLEVEIKLNQNNIPHTSHIVRNHAASQSVIDHAAKVNADLIIIVTGQESKWNEMLFGSSARNLISESTIPVLSVNTKMRESFSM